MASEHVNLFTMSEVYPAFLTEQIFPNLLPSQSGHEYPSRHV